MKTALFAFLILLPPGLLADEVKIGDSTEGVLSTMGTPRGRLRIADRERFCFDRGEIEVRNGTVTRVALRTLEAQAAYEAKSAADARRVQEEQARLAAAGEALKASKRTDAVFLATSPSYQVAFWDNFSRQYPGVPCNDELSVARARLAEREDNALAQANEARRAELDAQALEETRSAHVPIDSGYYPIGYDRGYFAYDGRQRRLDREYYDRVHPRSDNTDRSNDADQRDRRRDRDRSRPSDRSSAIFCASPSRPTATVFADRSHVSSHTAMAFTGQDWLVWPSPAQALR